MNDFEAETMGAETSLSGPAYGARPGPRISATVRFYVVFALALLVLVGISYEIGYRAGVGHARQSAARRAL